MAAPKTAFAPSVNQIVSLTPTAINPLSFMVETYTFAPIDLDMMVRTTQLTNVTAGTRILNSRVSAANTLEITWGNFTTGTVTLGATNFNVIAY